MNSKEYRQMAEMVRGLPEDATDSLGRVTKQDLIEALCQEFEASNVCFDRELFIKACQKETQP